MTFFFPCDLPVAEAMNHFRTLGGTFFFVNVSELVSPQTTAGLSLAIAGGLYLRRKLPAIAGLAVAIGGANAAWIIIKQLVERPRPAVSYASFIEPGYSFPSGHATNAFALGTFGALLLRAHVPAGPARNVLMAAILSFAAFTAFGRVYLGVHYVSDVVAGAALGVAFGFAGVAIASALERYSMKKAKSTATAMR